MGIKEDLEKISLRVERKLDGIKRKEEMKEKEKTLARDCFRCWRGLEGDEVDQFLFLRGKLEKEFDRFCKKEVKSMERLCEDAKKSLLSMNNK